jgi:CheY-like chemotaxis protein
MSQDSSPAVYCPACGVETSTEKVSREGKDVTICVVCGLTLEVSEALPYQPVGDIIFADDSDLLRLALEDMLLDKKLANSVIASSNGQEFLTAFTERLVAGNPPDLAMLDVQMPILNGFHAAISLRAVEKAFKRPKLTPIMFFSAYPCDEKAKRILQFCKKSIYVNKVSSPNLVELAGRVEQVLITLVTKGQP